MARLALRKQGVISGWISFPADAFSAKCPCFPATRLPFGRKGNHKSERGKGSDSIENKRIGIYTDLKE
jgi:hypothetical protein